MYEQNSRNKEIFVLIYNYGLYYKYPYSKHVH